MVSIKSSMVTVSGGSIGRKVTGGRTNMNLKLSLLTGATAHHQNKRSRREDVSVWEFLEILLNEGEDAAREAFPDATVESSDRFGLIVTIPSTPPEQEKQPKQ